jgi:hypothetical protein
MQPSGPPAWKQIPSWYLVGLDDHAIPPATQPFMAERAHSHIVEINSSHASLVPHSRAVTNLDSGRDPPCWMTTRARQPGRPELRPAKLLTPRDHQVDVHRTTLSGTTSALRAERDKPLPARKQDPTRVAGCVPQIAKTKALSTARPCSQSVPAADKLQNCPSSVTAAAITAWCVVHACQTAWPQS